MEMKKQLPELSKEALDYQIKMTNPTYFSIAMLLKLPSVVFWSIRIKTLNRALCEVTLPFTWKTQNPFKSIYFAAMAGAAELSTGALCQIAMAGKGQFSMLVVEFRSEFYKKANQKITFTCDQGKELFDLLDKMEPGNAEKLTLVSSGKNQSGEEIGKFFVTWSFKRKS